MNVLSLTNILLDDVVTSVIHRSVEQVLMDNKVSLDF
jgi:hypothetical protein